MSHKKTIKNIGKRSNDILISKKEFPKIEDAIAHLQVLG